MRGVASEICATSGCKLPVPFDLGSVRPWGGPHCVRHQRCSICATRSGWSALYCDECESYGWATLPMCSVPGCTYRCARSGTLARASKCVMHHICTMCTEPYSRLSEIHGYCTWCGINYYPDGRLEHCKRVAIIFIRHRLMLGNLDMSRLLGKFIWATRRRYVPVL